MLASHHKNKGAISMKKTIKLTLIICLVAVIVGIKQEDAFASSIKPPVIEPTIEKRPAFENIPNFPKLPYRNGIGKPEGIVLHSTGDTSKSLDEWIQYEQETWENAFVHAFADADHTVEIANTDYLGWGAGAIANKRFIHVELVEYPDGTSKETVLKSIEQYANYVAHMLHQYNLGAPDLMDDNGLGNMITHRGVSELLGGTTHTDPFNYLPKWDIPISYVVDRIQYYYNKELIN